MFNFQKNAPPNLSVGNAFLTQNQSSTDPNQSSVQKSYVTSNELNICEFHGKLVSAAQITISRPRSPTINNPQEILMVCGVAGAEMCENYINFMIYGEFSYMLFLLSFYFFVSLLYLDESLFCFFKQLLWQAF